LKSVLNQEISMKLQPDGDIQVAPGERVVVAVTSISTQYLAIFSDLLTADWVIEQPLQALGNGAREIRSFTAGDGGTDAFAITFDFVRNVQGQPDPDGSYEIAIRGDKGAFTIQKRILPSKILPINRPFLFEVVA
jgi:hypothetical protein